MDILSFDDTTFGIQECELDLARLYPESTERSDFEQRFEFFVGSDKFTRELCYLSGNKMKYCTEVFASDRTDDRPPVMLLLGNPASHSVASGICFAFEKGGSEHRFWTGLRKASFLIFDNQAQNDARRDALQNLEYRSPFRVIIAVFFSIPSPASATGWSGVAGVRRLLGTRAFREIKPDEEKRIRNLIFRTIKPAGIIAFQKDAYEGVRSEDSPAYSRDRANQGLLVGKYKHDENIILAGSPPTRLMHTRTAQQVLEKQKYRFSRQFGRSSSSIANDR